MKITISIFLIFFSLHGYSQYFPRGVNINDNYLPNLDEPDKWVLGFDGMFDLQRESSNTGETASPLHRLNFNIFYGGQIFRAGLQVAQEFKQDVKDISLGLGFTYGRPWFLEAGVGYVTRSVATSSFDGTGVQLKLGYYFTWHMHIKYRIRVRLALASSYKQMNSGTGLNVLSVYPLFGFEFET